jgi:hypothetical protein
MAKVSPTPVAGSVSALGPTPSETVVVDIGKVRLSKVVKEIHTPLADSPLSFVAFNWNV